MECGWWRTGVDGWNTIGIDFVPQGFEVGVREVLGRARFDECDNQPDDVKGFGQVNIGRLLGFGRKSIAELVECDDEDEDVNSDGEGDDAKSGDDVRSYVRCDCL